jgi:flavin-dependent dehydrogenase
MLPKDSPQFDETLTDVDGKKHNTTIPRGKIQPKVWQRLLDRQYSLSNPYFVELMEKINEPFVSAIRDFEGSKAVFFDGKLLLAGDALAQCRPHGGGSTSQAALQAGLLAKVWNGEMTLEEWEETCLQSAAKAAQYSLAMAQFFWNGKVTAVMKTTVESGSQ